MVRNECSEAAMPRPAARTCTLSVRPACDCQHCTILRAMGARRGDQALKVLDASVEDAIAIGHKLSPRNTLCWQPVRWGLLAGDLARAERFIGLLGKELERSSLGTWHLFAGCFQGQIIGCLLRSAFGWLALRRESLRPYQFLALRRDSGFKRRPLHQRLHPSSAGCHRAARR